ncbi:MAG: Zn-ribbon domain-containing OB-fold protein [Alphaproteobacteria bacterium]|nr:Zn-ribbon domain-containing OB-fold protein [Alphaproteobacteria bacterium]
MQSPTPRTVVDFLKYGEDGSLYLEGHRCRDCGAVYFGRRSTCSKCFSRSRMDAVAAPPRGHLYAYTIVHRSFPGVETPFIHAVVDVEGGGALRGTLLGVPPDPDDIEMGMPISITFEDAGQTDREGNRYMTYFFRPA